MKHRNVRVDRNQVYQMVRGLSQTMLQVQASDYKCEGGDGGEMCRSVPDCLGVGKLTVGLHFAELYGPLSEKTASIGGLRFVSHYKMENILIPSL